MIRADEFLKEKKKSISRNNGLRNFLPRVQKREKQTRKNKKRKIKKKKKRIVCVVIAIYRLAELENVLLVLCKSRQVGR